jgi:predicted ABC-type ATPase
MTGALVVLTGASGSGKTTLAHAIKDRYPGQVEVLFFDSIGIPPVEEMNKWGHGYQPGGAWQRAMTLQWFPKLAGILSTGRSILFEGQMRLAFIREALETCGISSFRVILIDCDNATRVERLNLNRRQPHLGDQQMMRWADYLRGEFLETGYEILDTGKLSLDACVEQICSYF